MLPWLANLFGAQSSLSADLVLRAVFALFTAFVVGLFVGPFMIRRLTERLIGQTVRKDGPQTHYQKAGTPTMGGVLMLFGTTVSTLLWAQLGNVDVWIALATLLAFGAIGLADDTIKLLRKNPRGIGARAKFAWQTAASVVSALAVFLTAKGPAETVFHVPLLVRPVASLGIAGFTILGYLVVTGASNAVNLTDGLDGLAAVPTALVASALGLLAYLAGSPHWAAAMYVPFVPGAGELLVFCCAMAGSALGFLWFNAYPAQVFMGDVGALALGGALGIVAVMIRQEILLFVMGGVFVAETVSVMLQVGSFKLTRRRIFRMAPLHHHFELKGWPESRVIVRFWIASLLLVVLGLSTLGVRI